MDVYLQTMAGVAVSVVLFLIGYRQTVGARRERVRAANTDVERTLVRRIVLDSYTPALEDVTRLIDGKARDYRLNARELLSESQLMNTLFTRMLETDFLTPQQRGEVVGRVSAVLEKAEAAPVPEAHVLELPSRKERDTTWGLVGLLGLAASSLGGLASVWLIGGDGGEMWWALGAAFAMSVVAITMITLTYRFRESQEEPGREAALVSALDFENEVWRALRRINALPAIGPHDAGFDFVAEVAGKKILVEVKAWSRRPPLSLVRAVLTQLTQALEAQAADEGILVVQSPLDLPAESLEAHQVRVMTFRELRNYIMHATK